MESRGQAYSVFKLLIAAVIAGAILVILLQVIGNLPILTSQEPNEVAAGKVQSQINLVGSPSYSDATFSNGLALTSRTIADKSNVLTSDSVCVGVSPSIGNTDDFDPPGSGGGAGQIVQYKGTFNQLVRLLVICDRGNELEDVLNDFESSFDFDLPSLNNCSYDTTTSAKACLVLVVPGV